MAKHAWQDKMRKAGKGSLTVFLDDTLIKKIKARAKAKGKSVADYLNKVMWSLYKQQEQQIKK